MSNKPQMVTGFNHNIKHGGQIYHVQTEDSGVANPHIITHLFVGGNILATKKTSYADIVKADNLQEIVKELMQEQHKAMLRNLINGVYDDIASASTATTSPGMQVGTESSIPDKFPVPTPQNKPPSTIPSQPAAATSKPAQTASTVLPKTVPIQGLQTPAKTQAAQPVAKSQSVLATPPSDSKIPSSEAATVLIPRAGTTQPQATQVKSQPPPSEKAPATTRSPVKTTGSAGGFSRPKTSPKIFVPKDELEKIPSKKAPSHKVAIQAKSPEKGNEKTQAEPTATDSSSLPPEVLAARRLEKKPKPKDTSGPTIFGDNLISEKSLDEVILGYLAGNDDDKV